MRHYEDGELRRASIILIASATIASLGLFFKIGGAFSQWKYRAW